MSKTTKKKVSKQRYYNDFPVDSDGEIHFIMWMEELKQNGCNVIYDNYKFNLGW